MRQALLNLQPLLRKWAFIATILCLSMSTYLMNASADTTPRNNSHIAENDFKAKEQIKKTEQLKKVTKLPPYVSEADVQPEVRPQTPIQPIALRPVSAGNTYAPGNCTWYAKSKRPDLPNNLGNANTWVARARMQNLPTGTEPQVGAIGQQGMHVVYVERVNPDGTVFISEMNYRGLGVVSTRTVSSSSFKYIY